MNLHLRGRLAATAVDGTGGSIGGTHQVAINRHFAEFIDDDHRLRQIRRAQRSVDQGCLAAAEKTGDQGHRNPRSRNAGQPLA